MFETTAYCSVKRRLMDWVPLLACPAVRKTRLDKPTVAPLNLRLTEHYSL